MDKMTDSRAAEVLAAHNEWRRGGDGPETDPTALGLALDHAISRLRESAGVPVLVVDHVTGSHAWPLMNIPSGTRLYAAPQPPAEAQAQGGGEVRAKPLEWQEDGPGEWCDRHHGFHITQDDEEPQESRFTAAWGECDPERFSTLEEAQAWCQEALDRYIREWVAPAPPSAPVGVEGFEQWYARVDARFWNNWDACNAAFHAGQNSAISQRLAGDQRSTHGVWRKGEWQPCYCAADSDHGIGNEQPAAVDRAMVERIVDAIVSDPMNNTDSETLRVCVSAALSAQPGGGK